MTELSAVTLKERYPLPIDKMYELLTEPHFLEKWFSPALEVDVKVQEYTLEIGGDYKLAYLMPDGDMHVVTGKFCSITPPNTVAFTWKWIGDHTYVDIETLVTMTLSEQGTETELTVLHEQLPAGEMLENHKGGWQGTLQRLHTLTASLGKQANADDLLARIRLLTAGDELTEQRQFGGNSFMHKGNMLCCVGKHGMMARVGKEQEADALKRKGAKPFDVTGRRMGGLVSVDADSLTDTELREWLDLAFNFVGPMPQKVKKPKKSKTVKKAS